MKRLLSMVSIAVLLTFSFILVDLNVAYAAQIPQDANDQVFVNTITELALEEGYYGGIDLIAEKEIIYDYRLDELGFVYDFTVNGDEGFAIMIIQNSIPTITEIFFNTQIPFLACSGKLVYLLNNLYVYFDEGNFYTVDGHALISEDSILAFSERFYCADSDLTNESETIYYTSRSSIKYNVAYRYPALSGNGQISNGCVAVAGANLIVYWDRFVTNLIPDYEPGSVLAGKYIYKSNNATTNDIINQINNDMRTGSTNVGITIAQFRQGMIAFCNRKNRNVSFTSCMSVGNFNYNVAKQKLEANTPLILFLDTYNVASFIDNPSDKEENIEYLLGHIPHAMIGFGYEELSYTLTNGVKRTDKYIAVASGIKNMERGYFNIAYKTQIEQAYAVNIY